MNIIIFGAAGRTGRLVVQQALERGHHVSAFVRQTNTFHMDHPHFQRIEGDALQREDVVNAIAGHDAVLSCLGGKGTGPSTVLTEMTTNIVAGMNEADISRIVYCASAGIYGEIPGMMGKFAQHILRHVLKDHQQAVTLLIQHDLHYTVARPLQLIDTEPKYEYRTSTNTVPENGQRIARSDVAHFMLDSLEQNRFIRETVGLAY